MRSRARWPIGLFGAVTLAGGLVPPSALVVFLGLTFAMGVSSPLYSAPQMALMQERVDPECMAASSACTERSAAGPCPWGSVASTLFADAIGVSACFVLIGAAMVILSGITWAIPSIRKIG